MSCGESIDIVYICRYPPKVFYRKADILYQMFYDLRWSDLSNMGDICKIGKKNGGLFSTHSFNISRLKKEEATNK